MDIATITAARETLAPYIHRTPLWPSRTLSEMLGRKVSLKLELFQKTGSYKPRGMVWALHNLDEAARRAGAITFSAGNAAQGLAYAGTALGIATTVVMAETANPTKVAATRGYGAEVIQHGLPVAAAHYCQHIAAERGLRFVSSYDDDDLMTGHASLGMEIIEDCPDVGAIFLGIGGGGMAGGLVKAMEAAGHKARLYGAEPAGAAAMSQSLAAGHAVKLDSVETIADGLAAPSAGELCFDLVRRRFAGVTVVDDAAILRAMRLLMERCKIMPEPAGAAGLAALIAEADRLPRDAEVVCVISGGNVDLARLRTWLEPQ